MEEDSGAVFGKPSGIGATDKTMLEMTDTNRLVFDSYQSELIIALELLYDALVARDNIYPHSRKIQDYEGRWTTEYYEVDNWKWIKRIIYNVKTNQLTIKGYSRNQHLRQAAAAANILTEPERDANFLQRMFGIGT